MIKESIFSFLKIRKMPIIIFTGIVVIFGILFYLYDIPFDAIIYGCELSFVWCAVCLFIGIIFHHVDVIGIKNPVRRDDFESECFVCHRITYLLYLANTSSIFPAFKNIPSGISSYLPSRISLNP